MSKPGFWRVLGLLLATSWRRAAGRRARQQALLSQRQRGGRGRNWAALGVALYALLMVLLHACAAVVVINAVSAGERVQAEARGAIVVHSNFIEWVRQGRALERAYRGEAARIAHEWGGDVHEIAPRLRAAVQAGGTAQLADVALVAPGLRGLPWGGAVAAWLGSAAILLWGIMLIFQGEGLELDVQRRRHPMWEWLFSHPVPPAAVFVAEMLAPIAANPVYFTAPFFPGLLYGFLYGRNAGIVAGLLIGIPLTVAAACLGRALEIGVTLRVPARSRGAIAGLMSWLGYVTMLGFVVLAVTNGTIVHPLAARLAPLATGPMPFLALFLGLHDGAFSLARGMAANAVFAVFVIAFSVGFSVWGARRGLSSNAAPAPAASRRSAAFGRDALYKKELLWLVRDRSALVQAVLVPLSLASFQIFNLRGLLAHAGTAWNTLCGAAILFGTYFLVVLGPKSLASEGQALWITLTWPQGLEKLLKAKAWLWTLISTAIVSLVLCYAVWLFPASAWKVGLAGGAWFLFARSMAEKTVTLATVTSESGEIQKVPRGRRLAAQLGTVTFAVGVLTQQWNIAMTGVVYSMMTAAAMWQNFRARLPYLYDQWSEELPRPPTLMHAMIGISVLVEAGAALNGALLAIVPHQMAAVFNAAIYGACAAAVAAGSLYFLYRRGVRPAEIWCWGKAGPMGGQLGGQSGVLGGLGLGGLAGIGLGVIGLGYVFAIRQFPEIASAMDQAHARMYATPHLHGALIVMAVLIAPPAEEFLFRGLLYRALDREWGGWRAVAASAAFFASYHPALSWLPVALLGAVNASLFKKTGRLGPAIACHMIYNGVILMA